MNTREDLQIETSRLALRPFAEQDAAALSRCSSQPGARRFLPDMVWDTEADALRFIRWFNKEKFNAGVPHAIFGIYLKPGLELIGFAGVGPKPELGGEIELGFLVAAGHQNNGYATEAAKAAIWWAFEKAGQDVLAALADPENAASRRVLDKLGFVRGGARTFPDGPVYDYYRFYHSDILPGPEWDARSLYGLEPMGAFFDARADGYDEHMLGSGLSGEGIYDYQNIGGCFPETGEALRVLDIGCGTGIELDHIWNRAPNAHITCVDISRAMLDLLLKNHPGGRGRITIVEASYVDWDYPREAFDIAVSHATMHHFWPDEKIGIYRKVFSALKPGGSYLEGDFIVDALASEHYRRRYENITAGLPHKAGAGEYHIDIPMTIDVQRKLLLKAGFASVEVLYEDIKASGSGAILKAVKREAE